ncbi:hypothetical protein [Halobacillus seohaensis]|uniref:hypothetical protein n=1 Tax=Halobacillus seohaensis TaxID=447421 RepID=UPI0036F4303B
MEYKNICRGKNSNRIIEPINILNNITIGKEKRLDILISKRFSLYFLLQLKYPLLEESASRDVVSIMVESVWKSGKSLAFHGHVASFLGLSPIMFIPALTPYKDEGYI